jgi:hypothetical protein
MAAYAKSMRLTKDGHYFVGIAGELKTAKAAMDSEKKVKVFRRC